MGSIGRYLQCSQEAVFIDTKLGCRGSMTTPSRRTPCPCLRLSSTSRHSVSRIQLNTRCRRQRSIADGCDNVG